MFCSVRKSIESLPLICIAVLVALQPGLAAGDHVVKPADLQKAIEQSARSRQESLASVRQFLTIEPAARVLSSTGTEYRKVERALAQLDDEELARLAARADKVRRDFEAGSLTNQEITYIIIALATAVLILVIVAAR